jgi:hypothetical protein
MKRIVIVVMAVLMIVAAAFAYLLKTDENGRPYGVYEVNVVGSGGGAGSMYLLNSTGASSLYTPLIGGNYLLGSDAWISDGSGTPITSITLGSVQALDVNCRFSTTPYYMILDSWGQQLRNSTISGSAVLPTMSGTYDYNLNGIMSSVIGTKRALDVSAITSWYDGSSIYNNLLTNPLPFALYGYPSSAQNLFENTNTRPLYTKKAGGTITGTTTGNGTTTIFTPTGSAVVSNVVLTTESNAGSVVVEFAAGTDIAKIYCARQTSFNSGEIKSTGSSGNAVQIVRASFAGSEEVFYSITYTEE